MASTGAWGRPASLGVNTAHGHIAALNVGHFIAFIEAEFVQPFIAGDDEGALRAEPRHRIGIDRDIERGGQCR